MQRLQEKEKTIIDYASQKNILIEKNAMRLLKRADNFKEIIDNAEKKKLFFLNARDIEERLINKKISTATVEIKKKGFKPYAKETDASIRILHDLDVTGQSCAEGNIKDFLHFFQNKFNLLSEMLKKRHTIEAKPIKRLRTVSKNNRIDLIGMVNRKWITKKGHVALKIEDLESQCIALILKDDAVLTEAAEHVLLDDVIAVKAIKFTEDLVIVKEILWPDLPIKNRKKGNRQLELAALSDIHVGSKLFLEKQFNRFLDWINGRVGSRKEKEKISKIKYIIISGDNVDGIGVYPNQFTELNIKDINKQYEEFSKLIMQIPEYIEVIIGPGQHDAVRWAEPQPAISKQFLPELHGLSNIHLVGNPSWAVIEGLKTLIYHGASLHDLIASVSFLDSAKPATAMVELLKKRNLMPSYGLKQPYVAEKKDFLIIKEEPDLVFMGDMHHNDYQQYRGTTIINSGTWQDRTSYQIKLGHIPTPCIVPVIDLESGKIKEHYFLEEKG